MPVFLEQISEPSPEDLRDLIKIYQDYPQIPTDTDEHKIEHWINSRLSQQHVIFAGRFNGRLLTAIWGKPDKQLLQLEDLCVRTVTRRRGVARQLLTLLIKQANREQLTLLIKLPSASIELHSLLSELGFSCSDHNQLWTLKAKP